MDWYIQITWDYIVQMLPCALFGALGFFCLRPYRSKRLAGKELFSGIGREGVLLLFVLFSAGLSALTIWPAGFWSAVVNRVVPVVDEFSVGSFYWEVTIFRELAQAGDNITALGRSFSLFMLLGNLIMFMPFGFFPALVGSKPKWWKSLLTGFCVSAFIEVIQLFIGRSSDINDIILNTTGALCGFWVYLLITLIAPKFIARFKLQKTEVSHGREAGNQTAL